MKNLWEIMTKSKQKEVENFCSDYKNFLSSNKTERECISSIIDLAKQKGYKNLDDLIKSKTKLKPGDKIYSVNMGKTLILIEIGSEKIENGLNIVGAHVDSPRLDLKSIPLYEDTGFAMLDTHYYGGIKKYQWLATPLSLHGVVCKKDGTKIVLNIGENDSDPVFCISDILPHLESEPKTDKMKGEVLNVIAGSKPSNEKTDSSEKIKANILNILKEKGIDEDDFASAEIEVVPAGKARDMGFDKSMILAYGQDDRVCAYTALRAMLEQKTTAKRTRVCMFVDKEEIGSVGATGMESRFFENTISEISNLLGSGELEARRALKNSYMLSSDVTAAFDPNSPEHFNKPTEAYLNGGISFNKYTGSRGKSHANDANAEFIAKLRKNLDEEGIKYQFTEMGKVDEGGGGTIAYIMARFGMEVIDAGVPLLNMHAPWEISSKADIFEAYSCYKKFFEIQ